nr:hypothetical protein [Vampirovibrio sp.]
MIQMKKLAVLGLAAIFAGTSQVVPIAPIAQVQANQLAMLDPGVQQVKHPRKKKNVPTLPTSVIDAEQTNPEANLDPGTSLLLLSTFLSDYELSDYHTGSLFSLIHPETLREFSTLSFMNGASLEWPSFEFGASHESAALMAMANSADDLNSGQLQPKPDIIADVNPASMQQHPVDMAQLDNLKPWESVQNVFQQLIPQHVMKNNPLDAVNTLAFEQPTAKPALLAEQANELQAFWGLNPDGSLNLPTIHTSNEGPLNNTPYNDAPMVSEHILALQQADPQLDFPGESPAVLRSGVSTTSNEIEVTVDKSTILNLN